MRKLEPFSFFVGHASAIEGFGGPEPSPDPRYCFHTNYQSLPPGRAKFHATMHGASATTGELNLRVMSFQPGSDASMVTSAKLILEDMVDAHVVRTLRFTAVEGVEYALYGYFTDSSDLVAESLDIELEEADDPDLRISRSHRRSKFAGAHAPQEAHRLFSAGEPSLAAPTCQPFTRRQADAIAADPDRWMAQISLDDALDRWRVAAPLQALSAAGLLQPGARGVVINAPHDHLAEAVEQHGCLVHSLAAPEPDDIAQLDETWTDCDFAIGHEAPSDAEDPAMDLLVQLMDRLANGGLAIGLIDIHEGETAAGFRNRMQRIALRLIGRGHNVAQLSFPDGGDWFPTPPVSGGFLVLAQK